MKVKGKDISEMIEEVREKFSKLTIEERLQGVEIKARISKDIEQSNGTFKTVDKEFDWFFSENVEIIQTFGFIPDSTAITVEAENYTEASKVIADYLNEKSPRGLIFNVSFQGDDGEWRWFRSPSILREEYEETGRDFMKRALGLMKTSKGYRQNRSFKLSPIQRGFQVTLW